ncbi:MAG: transcriptional activator NhaR [Deltaproteobacteria bacterium]|jgi:LysR family transcriptional activator of nhaA|nr:transcriptional activator NhaR [Deltaproteobacteria bacterium]
MEWLNYHHLLYFWAVAKHGSVARASQELKLAQPTLSGQVRSLERSLGEKLFKRAGRGLALTEAGTLVFGYADEIFGLGRELTDTLKGRPSGRPQRLSVGISDVLPKLVTQRLLEPALRLDPPTQLVCREDKTERLLAELSLHSYDLVLADSPVTGSVRVRAFNHLLGECSVTAFGTKTLAERHRRGFPRSLDGAPVLLPTDNTLLRRSLDQWIETQNIRPRVVAEFEDSALLKVFGQKGEGIFFAPTVIEEEIRRQYEVVPLGRVPEVRERFYAITVERRIKHPAALAICEAARGQLFGA